MTVLKRIKAAIRNYKRLISEGPKYDCTLDNVGLMLSGNFDSYNTSSGKAYAMKESIRILKHNTKMVERYRRHPKLIAFQKSLKYLWSPWWEEWDARNK